MSLVKRFSAAWWALVGTSAPAQEREEDPAVALRRDLAAARLELQEAKEALAAERSRAAALEKAQVAQVREGVESRLEELFAGLAAPLSQLRTQAALLDSGTAVAASDVMILARRFADMAEGTGLEPIGNVGEAALFDPGIAQPLGSDSSMEPGDPVTVRFIGYRFHGRVLRKALVEPTR